ncbi:MAG: adenylate cyclase [Phycisphaerae bacterium]|nr:MAG: adenylate cyclase [Phycisphaerae bacterium]
MNSIWEHLQVSFRIADAADIVLISLFIYAFFMWSKSTASRQMLVGLAVAALVYVLARAFNLYMTAAMFQGALAFAAVAVIVVFQEDLRRFFARLASLGKLGRSRNYTSDPSFDVIVETVFELAKKKTGALLVIQGTEPLERHTQGGVATDARISKALLDSIFDPHSLGHDGAVIIDQNRIAQFGARLPLSENSEEIGGRGTRHCAALGLSELSDAMVMVVSEERGLVSVAEGGSLERIDAPVALKLRLERFTERVRPRTPAETSRRFFVENPGLKVAAVFLASLAWFLVSFEAETVQKTFVVPIEYRNLADTMDIDDSAPTEARVTLTGYERAFTLLAPSTLKVSLDLSTVTEAEQQIVIDDSNFKTPSNLSLFRSVPRVVSFGVHVWVKSQASVELRTEGRLPRKLREREMKVVPEAVQVLVWRSLKASNLRIYTEPIDLSRMTDATETKAKLILPQHMRLENDQPTEVLLVLDAVPTSPQATDVPQGQP